MFRPESSLYIGTTQSIAVSCPCPPSAISFDTLDGTFYYSANYGIYKAATTGTSTFIAQLSSVPGGLAYDAANSTLYASNIGGYAIDAIDAHNNVTVLAGGSQGTADGQGSAAQFQDPTGLVLDSTNNLLYVADGNTVRSISTGGLVTTLAHTGITGFSVFSSLDEALTVDPVAGTLYLADPYQNVILSVSNRVVSWVSGREIQGKFQQDGPPTSALFDQPEGIVFSPIDHYLYISDEANNQVRRIGANNITKTIAGDGRFGFGDGTGIGAEFYSPTGITIDPNSGLLYVPEWGYAANVRSVTTIGTLPPRPKHGIEMLSPRSVPNAAFGAALGADGTFWFTETASNKIGHVLSNGSIREIPLPGGFAHPTDMVLGGDGNVWFDDGQYSQFGQTNNFLAKIQPNGLITEYSMQQRLGFYAAAGGLTLGPDSNVWFFDPHDIAIGYITPTGSMFEAVVNAASGIATGPDGDLWTTVNPNEIDRNAPNGTILNRYTVTGPIGPSIVRGSDNRLWFVANGGYELGALDTSGTVNYYQVPRVPNCSGQCDRAPAHLAASASAVWFVVGGTSLYQSAVAEMSVRGAYSEFPIPAPHSQPADVVVGANNWVWFSDSGANKVGHTY